MQFEHIVHAHTDTLKRIRMHMDTGARAHHFHSFANVHFKIVTNL